ncbi:MAG: DNA repair protein RecO [Brevinematales bacterium]|nr:DNA repair protein RecO [Brevinematales bacterium]
MLFQEKFIEHFEGIIIKKNPFGEGHAVFNILDKNRGKLEVFSFGSDREKSRRRSILIIPNIIEGIIFKSSKQNYYSIKEVSLIKSFENITQDLKKTGYLFLVLEILDIFNEFETLVPYLYENTKNFLEKLDLYSDIEKYAFYVIFNPFNSEGFLLDFKNKESFFNYFSELPEKFTLGNGSLRFLIDVISNQIDFFESKKISPSVTKNLLDLIKLITIKEKNKVIHSFSILT